MTTGAENMLNIRTMRGDELPQFLAQGMVPLTNPDSAHRKWITAIADGRRPEDIPDDLLYAVAEVDDDFDIVPIGWTSLYLWDGIPCLEGFVAPDWRGRRIASACASALRNCMPTPPPEVGVFSDECERIAKWLGFSRIIRYRRVDDGWVKSHVA